MNAEIEVIDMRLLRVKPGSDEWLAARKEFKCASDASVMMAESKNMTRGELVRITAAGTEKEFSEWVKKNLLEKGHGIEARERPHAAQFIKSNGLDDNGMLFPVVVVGEVNGVPMLASTDGRTASGRVVWECKTWNEQKAAQVDVDEIPKEDLYQCTQQMLITDAEYLVYTLVNEDQSKRSYIIKHKSYFEQFFNFLMLGWARFDSDVEEERKNPKLIPENFVAEHVENLPIVRYQLNGLTLTSNIDALRERVQIAVAQTKKELNNDQDFANLEAMCKMFSQAEKNIETVIEQVLSEFGDVDAFRRSLAEIKDVMRIGRLAGEKKVKNRKEEIKKELHDQAFGNWAAFIESLNERLGGNLKMPTFGIGPDIAAAMRNKKTFKSMSDAIDAELANAKIIGEETYRRVKEAKGIFNEHAETYGFLFRDAQELVNTKDNDTIRLIVKARIDDYEKVQEQKRVLEKEQEERIAREEKERLEQQEKEAPKTESDSDSPVCIDRPVSMEEIKNNESMFTGSHTQDMADPGGDKTISIKVVDLHAVLQEVIDGNLPVEAVSINLPVIYHCLQSTGVVVKGIEY